KISITDQDIADFYKQYRTQFNVAEAQYRISMIVITPSKDPALHNRKNDDASSDMEARRNAAALVQQLENGAGFAQLATDDSEHANSIPPGGGLGSVPESSLSKGGADPELKKAVLALKPGQTSGVISVPNGYRILKLVAKEAPGQRDLNDPQVQQSIRD